MDLNNDIDAYGYTHADADEYDYVCFNRYTDAVNDLDGFIDLYNFILVHGYTHADADECGHIDGHCDARYFADSNLVAYGNADGHLDAYRYGYADTDEYHDAYGHHRCIGV